MRSIKHTISMIALSCLCWSTSYAANTWSQPAGSINASNLSNPAQNILQNQGLDTGTFSRGLLTLQDDLTPDQELTKINLTPAQQHEGAVWGLTPLQEQRYVFLLQNKAGLRYAGKNLSPVWILGLNARSPSERELYAQLAASQERQFIAQTLAWQSAYAQAYQSLVQGLPIIKSFDTAAFSPYSNQAHPSTARLQAGDSLDLFVDAYTPIRAVIANLFKTMQSTPQLTLNIFMVGKKTDATTLQAWAKAQAIPLDWVQSKRITLNVGNTQYEALKMTDKTLPLLLRVRDGEAIAVNTGAL